MTIKNTANSARDTEIHNIPVIAIDGPSGAGKGTVSRAIAKHLGWHYLDSGAIYRALAIWITDLNIPLADAETIAEQASVLELEFEVNNILSVFLAKMDITDRLSTEKIGNVASKIAALPEVRKALLLKQRQFRRAPGLVADGRDMGSVVFPDATYKIFLTASAKIRGQRRYNQLKEKGINVNLDGIIEDIEIRDHRDRTRKNAPLIAAQDARTIDSSTMSIDQVVNACLNLLK